MKAYNDLPQNNLKFIIAKYRWLYQLGLQGPDMFFYNLPVLRHRDHRNVGSYMHEHHVNDFFRSCFEQLGRIESKQQRAEGLAFMCGFMCHYVGDSICLNGMETQFISRFLSSCINEAFYPVSYKHRYQVSAAMIHRSILAMRFGCRTLADPNSRKKDKIEFFESLFLKTPVASSKLVTDTVENPGWSLNLNHETWCNPWDRSIASKASFPDLFRQSLGKLDILFYMINCMLDEEHPFKAGMMEQLLSELGNYSYHSGLECVDE